MGQAGSTIPPSNSPTVPLEGEASSVTMPAPVLAAAALQGAAVTHAAAAATAQGILTATLAGGAGRAAHQRGASAGARGGCNGNCSSVPCKCRAGRCIVGMNSNLTSSNKHPQVCRVQALRQNRSLPLAVTWVQLVVCKGPQALHKVSLQVKPGTACCGYGAWSMDVGVKQVGRVAAAR